jgi:hypothetical protein
MTAEADIEQFYAGYARHDDTVHVVLLEVTSEAPAELFVFHLSAPTRTHGPTGRRDMRQSRTAMFRNGEYGWQLKSQLGFTACVHGWGLLLLALMSPSGNFTALMDNLAANSPEEYLTWSITAHPTFSPEFPPDVEEDLDSEDEGVIGSGGASAHSGGKSGRTGGVDDVIVID